MAEGGKIDSQIDEEGQIYYGKTREMKEKGGERERRGGRNEAATVTTVVAVFAKLPGSPVHV